MTDRANGKGNEMTEPTRVCEASAYCDCTDTGTAFHRFGVAYCAGHEYLLGFRRVRNEDPADARHPADAATSPFAGHRASDPVAYRGPRRHDYTRPNGSKLPWA